METKNMQLLTADKKRFLTKDGAAFYTADTYTTTSSFETSTPPPIFVLDAKDIKKSYGIVEPISCTVTQKKNDVYDLSLESIGGENFGANFLQGMRVLNIPIMYHGSLKYQYFRIYDITKSTTSSGLPRIRAEAQHIFYDLAWKTLPMFDSDLPGAGHAGLYGARYSGHANNVFNHILDDVLLSVTPIEDRFKWSCDITGVESTSTFAQENPISLVAALLDGNDSFVGRFGGRLYRDNFYFSINEETEGNRNSGMICYSDNLTGIDCEIDYSDCCTDVYAVDNYGHSVNMGLNNSDFDSSIFPRRITKKIEITYPDHLAADYTKALFEKDVTVWHKRHIKPTISIKITFAPIPKNSPFYALQSFEVGDKVSIFHEALGIEFEDIEIISKTYDVLRQKTLEIELGDFRKSITMDEFYSGSISVI